MVHNNEQVILHKLVENKILKKNYLEKIKQ